jgi:hypothetical protein
MASLSHSHHCCKLAKLLTAYFKSCGLATKAFDTLHALGITMSQKWAYRWSSGFGQSCDHVVSSHMHVAVTQEILSTASTFAIGDASSVSAMPLVLSLNRFTSHYWTTFNAFLGLAVMTMSTYHSRSRSSDLATNLTLTVGLQQLSWLLKTLMLFTQTIRLSTNREH